MHKLRFLSLHALAVFALAGTAWAQPVGTFTWQLQPFCNRLTVAVTQQGAVYTLDGFDDQCGAPQRAPLVGLATPNPDGSIGLGFHLVTTPGGRPLSVDARISLATISGTWSDSAGNTGTFTFNGAGAGSARPLPTIPATMLAPGSITAAQLAPGLIGTVAQTRVTGTCANGLALRGVNPDGTVACTNAATTINDSGASTGQGGSAIAIGANGLPIISHGNGTTNALRITVCGNPACTTRNDSHDIDDPGDSVGAGSSIAIGSDGLPIISHYNATTQALRVTHCGDATCTAGNVSLDVDDPVGLAVGQYSSIAIGADGLPVISHFDSTNSALRVTRCLTVTCGGARVTITADNPADAVGQYTAIAIGADGLPVISHWNSTLNALRVTHCGNTSCSLGNVSTNVDDPASAVGTYTSIAIGADGLPVISHQDSFSKLRVTHCGNVACTALNVSTTVDAPLQSVAFDTALAIGRDGLPLVAHYEFGKGIRITHCTNVACTAATSQLVGAEEGDIFSEPAMAIGADGLPVVSARAQTVQSLHVLKCGTITCQ